MPFHGLYHRIPSCYQGSNQFQAQKFHSNDHCDCIWPFSAIFDHFQDEIFDRFWGQTPYAFKIEPWFESVIFYRNVIMTHYAIIIIRDHWKKIVPKKTLVGFKHFFDKLLNWRIIWTKDIWETMVESVDICSEAGDPTFWLISIFRSWHP